MRATTDPSCATVRIAATSRYLPAARMQPRASRRDQATSPTSHREDVMRSIYDDTLRWKHAACASGETDASPKAEHTAPARHLAVEPDVSLVEMALAAARQAVGSVSSPQNRPIDQAIVCATSLEHDLALSCAGRLHNEFGSTHSPFAIGQLQGAGPFLAIRMVADMMAEDESLRAVLVVGAERWRPPFSRTVSADATLGDGAGAALIQRGAGHGWSVRGVTVHTPSSASLTDGRPDEQSLLQLINEACSVARLSASGIDWMVPPRIDPSLIRRIGTGAGLPVERIWYPVPDDIGYLCAADPLVQLDTLCDTFHPATGQRVLLWSTGLQGQAACAILEYVEG